MVAPKDFDATSRDERHEMLRRDLATDAPPSALLAYVDGEAAGWVKVSPRPRQPRLARTRNIQVSPEPFDDDRVWAITCFVVRREHRGKGIAHALLASAIEHARTHGARLIEGYPIDTAATKASSNDLYHGSLSSFLAAGFTETARRHAARPVVALPLA